MIIQGVKVQTIQQNVRQLFCKSLILVLTFTDHIAIVYNFSLSFKYIIHFLILKLLLVQIGDGELLSGWKLRRNQMLAMLLKKTVSTARSWILLLIQIFIPVLFLIITIVAERSVERNKDLPELELSLDSYDRPVTILSGDGPYKTGYLDILNNNSHLYEDIGNGNMTGYIVQKTLEATSTVRQRYILATTFDDDSIMALFNNQPYHSPPLALSMAVDSVVRSRLNSSYNIRLTNYPLPFTINSRVSG